MIRKPFIYACCGMALMATAACSNMEEMVETDKESFGTIHVGGLTMSNNLTTSVTRADAENTANVLDPATNNKLTWLKDALKVGLDITYGNDFNDDGSIKEGKAKHAKLKLDADNSGHYTFTSIDEDEDETKGKPAEWLGNGYHVFEGLYIPNKLYGDEISTAQIDVFEDQTNIGNTNYDILSQYTCMPLFPKSRIAATVNQISLPFQHRLARVIVHVVIDDDIKSDYNNPDSKKAVIKGYDKENNGGGKDCSLRFCGVKVLGLVNKDTHRPTWFLDPEIKLAPHFLEEREEIKVPQRDEEGNIKYLTSEAAKDTIFDIYHDVPTFDVIVRPTYYGQTAVMPDERTGSLDEDQKILDEKNSISFTVTLDNGMIYTKDVEFDMNPNEQTTITLVIKKEGVNVNEAGTNNWVTDTFKQDDYYGIDNTLGHNLSKAGSCWQRAYQISNENYGVTDGSNPKDPENNGDERAKDTQYLTYNEFISYLKEAKEGGTHHGDYFILTDDLVLPDDWEPFEFTGHLDGRHKKLTLPNGKNELFTGLNGSYEKPTYKVGEETITANIHTGVNGNTYPMLGYRAEILNLYLTNEDASLVSGTNTGNIYNCHIIGNGKFCETIGTNGQVTECTRKDK